MDNGCYSGSYRTIDNVWIVYVTNFKQPRRLCHEHLAWVRTHTCCVCGSKTGIEAHHLQCTGERGMGRKSSDRYAVPLCGGCHRTNIDAVHTVGSKHEIEWFNEREINCLQWAIETWHDSPYKHLEYDKPPQRVKTQLRKKHTKTRAFQQRNGPKSKPDQKPLKTIWPSRPIQNGQKIQSRDFDRRYRKKLNGQIVKRP